MEAGRAVKEIARELGVSEETLYNWKSKYGGMEVNEARRLKELEDENRRLKQTGRRSEPGQRGAEGGDPKKRLELVGGRQDVALVMSEHQSQRASGLQALDRGPRDLPISAAAGSQRELAGGVDGAGAAEAAVRISALWAHCWNAADGKPASQRIYRLYQREHLAVRRLKRKRLVRPGADDPLLSQANQEWAMDFVTDGLATGRASAHADGGGQFYAGMPGDRGGHRVIQPAGHASSGPGHGQRGEAGAIRCDNGPEFTSRHFMAWCEEKKIALLHIQPGKPMQNGHVESFNGRFRDECLNANWFATRDRTASQIRRVHASSRSAKRQG